ncbi:MAG: hypothetical protein PHW87_10160 [Methanothrix sp.]|nr:hypothetical protein [Methanothrix sp.]
MNLQSMAAKRLSQARELSRDGPSPEEGRPCTRGPLGGAKAARRGGGGTGAGRGPQAPGDERL